MFFARFGIGKIHIGHRYFAVKRIFICRKKRIENFVRKQGMNRISEEIFGAENIISVIFVRVGRTGGAKNSD